MKEYSCRACGQGGFSSAGSIAKHRHGECTGGVAGTKTAKRRKKARAKVAAAEKPRRKYRKRNTLVALPAPSKGSEGRCLQICMDAFEEVDLDDAARQRILDHLWARFYPQTEEEEVA